MTIFKSLGGIRKVIKLSNRRAGRVLMEEPSDSDQGSGGLLVTGKDYFVGLKMSVMTFDFSELELAENEVKSYHLNSITLFFNPLFNAHATSH